MLWIFFRQELRRNLHPLRVLALLGIAMILVYRRVGFPINGAMPHVAGAFTLHSYCLEPVVLLVAGAMSGTLAADRRAGFTLTVAARGGAKGRYLTPKLLGAAASSALMMLLVIACFYLLVALRSPPGRAAWEVEAWSRVLAPEVYRHDPVLHDGLVASTRIAAAASLSMIGVLAGVLVANEYMAMAAPPLFLVLASMALHDGCRALSPYVYLTLWRDYRGGAAPLGPPAFLLYWLVFGALFAGLSWWLFTRRELS